MIGPLETGGWPAGPESLNLFIHKEVLVHGGFDIKTKSRKSHLSLPLSTLF